MNTDRLRIARQRSRHLRLLEDAGIPFPAPGQDCDHPMRALRFDGVQEGAPGTPPMAWVTCTLPACRGSFLIPVREDVAHEAGEDSADVLHGGPLGHASEEVMPDDTTPEPADSTKSRGHFGR